MTPVDPAYQSAAIRRTQIDKLNTIKTTTYVRRILKDELEEMILDKVENIQKSLARLLKNLMDQDIIYKCTFPLVNDINELLFNVEINKGGPTLKYRFNIETMDIYETKVNSSTIKISLGEIDDSD